MTNQPKQTKAERRENVRLKAAALQKEQQRKDLTRRITLWVTVGVVAAAVLAFIIIIITVNANYKASASTTAPNNMGTDGFIMTSDTAYITDTGYDLETGTPSDTAAVLEAAGIADRVHIQIFSDYACPHCADFEELNGDYLNQLLADETVTVQYNPINALGAGLSVAGGNAAACVADLAPEQFTTVNRNLFTLTGSSTTSENDVQEILKALPVDDTVKDELVKCARSDVFVDWLELATTHAVSLTDGSGNQLVTGTPTILVDGYKYSLYPTLFSEFMEHVLDGMTPAEATETVTQANS